MKYDCIFDSGLPNLFFATRELSHDAFFCWLLSWARREYRETYEALHKTAIALMNKLLESCNITPPREYKSLEIHKQYHDREKKRKNKIDILMEINDDIALLIEDKKETREHSNQLQECLEIVKSNFPSRKPAPVYLKSGNLSSDEEDAVKKAGFALFRRRDLLTVLEEGEKLEAKSDIFREYLCWLRWFDRKLFREEQEEARYRQEARACLAKAGDLAKRLASLGDSKKVMLAQLAAHESCTLHDLKVYTAQVCNEKGISYVASHGKGTLAVPMGCPDAPPVKKYTGNKFIQEMVEIGVAERSPNYPKRHKPNKMPIFLTKTGREKLREAGIIQ